MNDATSRLLLDLTRQLLDAIARGDWETYQSLCDPTLSAFEPEACGHLVEGLEFHRFYFRTTGPRASRADTICSPHVRTLGTEAGVVSYVRVVQSLDANGSPQTKSYDETRVWQLRDETWRHVHFHRSSGA